MTQGFGLSEFGRVSRCWALGFGPLGFGVLGVGFEGFWRLGFGFEGGCSLRFESI